MARRAFIRNALKCPDPSYEETFKSEAFNENRWGQAGDILEDFTAVNRCIDHRAQLFAGLEQARLARRAASLAAWRGAHKITDGLAATNGNVALGTALDGYRVHDAEIVHGARGPPLTPLVVLKGRG
jgi:hypothetical protein